MHKFFQKFLQVHFLCIELLLIRNMCNCQSDNSSSSPDAKIDAKVIVDSKFDPKTVAKILPFRTAQQCAEINDAVASINGGKKLVPTEYEPVSNTSPYQDLLFALVNGPPTVFSKYMGHYLDNRDETFIIMIFAQVDDRETFKAAYDNQHKRWFDDARSAQRHPFANALKAWAQWDRCPNSACPSDKTCEFGRSLFKDRKNWNENRDKLELALMELPGDDSKDILHCYGKISGDGRQYFEKDIKQDIKNHVHNHDLVDLYTTLVRYIVDANDYLAEKLHDYCDGRDGWTMWIIVISRCRADTQGLDLSFGKRYNGVTLKQYLDTCKIEDPVFKDMLKNLVDPDSEPQRQSPSPPPSPPPPPTTCVS